jgi:hypothetical protein
MSNKLYIASHECEGAFIGTFKQIEEWMQEQGCHLWNTKFYVVGEEVVVGLGIIHE